jgi:sugar phosphate isomerase/epimerase
VRLAQAVEVPLLRVFGGPDQPTGGAAAEQEANAWVADALGQVAPLAEAAGVTILLETHDAFSSARRVADVLRRINSPGVAALWDSQHPYRLGETAETVVGVLGAGIRHFHVKDARRPATEDAPWPLVLLGEGDVPVRDQLQLLARQGYTGYISVEWEKKWHPEIPEPEIALPQHIAWLKANLPAN